MSPLVRLPVNRLPLAGEYGDYQSYVLSAPLATHWRPATCAEVDCGFYLAGWQTCVDEDTADGQARAYYIRRQSGRSFREHRDDTGLTVFTFEPGQSCFNRGEHRARTGRPEELLVVAGPDRAPRPVGGQVPPGIVRRTHSRPQDWVEDFAGRQAEVAEHARRG